MEEAVVAVVVGGVVVGVVVAVVLAGEVLPEEVVVQDCENGVPLTLLVTPTFTPPGTTPGNWVLIILPILFMIDCTSMLGSPSIKLMTISPLFAPGGMKPGGNGNGGAGPVPLPPPKLNVICGPLTPPGPVNPPVVEEVPPVELPNGIDEEAEEEPVFALVD